ncbi:MAG: lipoyl(octanoyl) transferase LipB [Actinomycetota bacterium]|nr:lipoyl(octanoyl) transferase LipB [Actinomycetota bacterium]
MPSPAWLIGPEGLVPFDVANTEMHDLAERRLRDEIPDTVILLQHPPVFTAGRRSRPDDLLWSEEEIGARGASIRRIDRGGSFTFHGPGQLVGYPILDLGSTPDAAEHLRRMEEAVIRTGADLGVTLHRRADVQTGVWHGDDKVCAIGVRLMRARVSLHGFALNCDPDLAWFQGIVACGLPENGVTSLSELTGRHIGVQDVRPSIEAHLAEVFDLSFTPAPEGVTAAFGVSAQVAKR